MHIPSSTTLSFHEDISMIKLEREEKTPHNAWAVYKPSSQEMVLLSDKMVAIVVNSWLYAGLTG